MGQERPLDVRLANISGRTRFTLFRARRGREEAVLAIHAEKKNMTRVVVSFFLIIKKIWKETGRMVADIIDGEVTHMDARRADGRNLSRR